MLIGYEMFLLAAEELNFSRAAERAFVTPQCLSDHIKRLEAHHHVTLFRRRPHLELTAEGAAMLRYLSRIKALEYRMKNELADISQGTRGTIRLGIPTTRGTILVPSMVPEFQKQYPNVDVQVRLNDTHKLEDLLLSGEIDLFLGVDAKEHPLFDKIELEREPLYLVVPETLLRTYYGDKTNALLVKAYQEGIDLASLPGIPLVLGHSASTTMTAVSNFLMQKHIAASLPIQVSNFSIMIDLCRSGHYSTICAQLNLQQLDWTGILPTKERLHILRIKGLTYELTNVIVSHRDSQSLHYVDEFKDLLKKFIHLENAYVALQLQKLQNTMISR